MAHGLPEAGIATPDREASSQNQVCRGTEYRGPRLPRLVHGSRNLSVASQPRVRWARGCESQPLCKEAPRVETCSSYSAAERPRLRACPSFHDLSEPPFKAVG